MTPALAALLGNGTDLGTLDGAALGTLLAECAVEQERLELARKLIESEMQRRLAEAPRGDRLVKRAEAAHLLGVTEDWLVRHRDLPFRVELSPGVVRYSITGIHHYGAAAHQKRG
jgi:hypothetical protein